MVPTLVLSALALVLPAFGAPTAVPIIKRAGPVKPDSYIVCVPFIDALAVHYS